ncbi:serine hydrolase [Mucilaginibacter sp. PAMC 26640]|nr:serine hydrolase [Mucilaginibacter sp. PAMC 26640]
MNNIYKTPFAIFLLILGTATVFAQNKATLIDSMIHRTNRNGLFSGNILVVDNGKTIYKSAMGYTDASRTAPLTESYRFHIGSIAKEFNAVGIMILAEQGKLKLDDKVSQYLPQLPAWVNTISIKNLLQYTSGLPDIKWKTVKGDADIMADLLKTDSLNFKPGTSYDYNNMNVFVQRRIIEKITGMPFNQFVVEKELKPAGMNTAIVDPVESTPLMAISYNNDYKTGALIYPITGWVAVTLDDFYKWELALEQFKLISPASTRILLTPIGPGKQCGLGGGAMDANKILFHKHDGISINYQAILVGQPKKGRVVILMTNNRQNNIFDIDDAIENILDGKPYSQPKRSVGNDFKRDLDTLSGEQIVTFYKQLKQKDPEKYAFDKEATLNEIGYGLLNAKRTDDAITVFEYNTKLFPASGNVFDSLGEAYYNKSDKAKALLNYKRSVALNPTNNAAKAIIGELEKK